MEGKGVPVDREEGEKWLRKAAAQGDSIAIMALRKYGL